MRAATVRERRPPANVSSRSGTSGTWPQQPPFAMWYPE